jgi:CHAD domain-containing protein
MREHVRTQTAILLRRFSFQMTRAARFADADSIHDLRVAIRRLSRCLRLFSKFYPDDSWKKIRKELSVILHAAGDIRDRDIAVELLVKAEVPRRSAIYAQLQSERRKAAGELRIKVRNWKADHSPRKWRSRLGL